MRHTEAIILKREDFRERDERISLYTKDFGKITLVAKGIRRIEAKLRGNLDIFNFVDIIFVEGLKYPILTAIDARERFDNLACDPFLYKASLGVTTLIADIFEERLTDRDFFDILYCALSKLDRCANARNASRSLCSWALLKKFQLKVLDTQGYSAGSQSSALQKIQGESFEGLRVSLADCEEIENSLSSAFAYHFNYRLRPCFLEY